MTVDISRVRFDPRNNYAWTIEQQGRVRLDADSLEGEAMHDRRWRSETYDILDRVALPVALPDSFRIDVVAGEIVIQPGRLYVDGLQPENHGTAPFVWNPILAETQGTGAVPFDEQPYRPGFDPGPLGPGRHIFYLDVWQRTVTFLEDPSLIEPAVSVDTTARGQTVWQVRDLADVGNSDCSTADAEVPGWLDIITPSAGRLSSRAHVGPPQNDPCLLPPGSGYTGLENRLYRVEIHDENPAGTFRFKWAIHNATVATAILSLPANDVLRVARVARDDVMRFNPGDWVEVTDDRRELEGTPGIFRQVQSVDDAAQSITLAAALPAGTLEFDGAGPELDQAFHPRLRKWDQAGVVRDSNGAMLMDLGAPGSEGLIPVPAAGTFVQLSDGVEVSFSLDPAGGSFRPGDFWVFTARTAGRVVEELDEAPPLGIHHHYARLAVVDVAAGGAPQVVEDCRPQPQKGGCCTFVVQPGEDIQKAVNALPDEGGCICLKVGMHLIDEPIVIPRDNVTLHGESMGAVVINRRGTGVLVIHSAAKVRIHTVDLRQIEGTAEPVVFVQTTEGLVIDDCRIETVERSDSVGLHALSANALDIRSVVFTGTTKGVWLDKGCQNVAISDCEFTMARVGANLPVTVAIMTRAVIGRLTIERNRITRAINGIIINDDPTGIPQSDADLSRICGNHITIVASPNQAERAFGIDIAADRSTVEGNQILYPGGNFTAIRLCGEGSSAIANLVASSADVPGAAMAIVVGHEANGKFLPLERIIIADNILEGAQNGIVVAGTARPGITGNILGRGGTDEMGSGIWLNEVTDALVTDNVVMRPSVGLFAFSGARNSFRNNQVEGGGSGIIIIQEEAPAISGNRLTGLDHLGIVVLGIIQRCDIVENRLFRCGSRAATATGIGAFQIFGEWHVEANEVTDTGIPPDAGGPVSPLAHGIFGDFVLEARIESNIVTYSAMDLRALTNEDRALLLRGMIEYDIMLAAQEFVFGFAVQIANNRFIGPGLSALVELHQHEIIDNVFARFERVMFNGNYCGHFSGPRSDQIATVSLVGRRCTVSHNQVKATTPRFFSYHFHGMPGPFIGNVSTGHTLQRPAEVPSPEGAFNQIA